MIELLPGVVVTLLAAALIVVVLLGGRKDASSLPKMLREIATQSAPGDDPHRGDTRIIEREVREKSESIITRVRAMGLVDVEQELDADERATLARQGDSATIRALKLKAEELRKKVV